MIITAIDPGNVQSAIVVYEDVSGVIVHKQILPNEDLLHYLDYYIVALPTLFVIEMVASYGMAVGKSVFETVFWIGRFYQCLQAKGCKVSLMYRLEVKTVLCHDSRAKDSNIRQVCIDRLGAPGTKKNPGKTFGVSKDIWSALALALAFSDVKYQPKP